MICSECAWEADIRKTLSSTRVDADVYLNRPSMKGRGHKSCKGCDCHHSKRVGSHICSTDGR